ncbi:hypothetical protein MT418_001228 [Batrachochytrium dendrobatidis]
MSNRNAVFSTVASATIIQPSIPVFSNPTSETTSTSTINAPLTKSAVLSFNASSSQQEFGTASSTTIIILISLIIVGLAAVILVIYVMYIRVWRDPDRRAALEGYFTRLGSKPSTTPKEHRSSLILSQPKSTGWSLGTIFGAGNRNTDLESSSIMWKDDSYMDRMTVGFKLSDLKFTSQESPAVVATRQKPNLSVNPNYRASFVSLGIGSPYPTMDRMQDNPPLPPLYRPNNPSASFTALSNNSAQDTSKLSLLEKAIYQADSVLLPTKPKGVASQSKQKKRPENKSVFNGRSEKVDGTSSNGNYNTVMKADLGTGVSAMRRSLIPFSSVLNIDDETDVENLNTCNNNGNILDMLMQQNTNATTVDAPTKSSSPQAPEINQREPVASVRLSSLTTPHHRQDQAFANTSAVYPAQVTKQKGIKGTHRDPLYDISGVSRAPVGAQRPTLPYSTPHGALQWPRTQYTTSNQSDTYIPLTEMRSDKVYRQANMSTSSMNISNAKSISVDISGRFPSLNELGKSSRDHNLASDNLSFFASENLPLPPPVISREDGFLPSSLTRRGGNGMSYKELQQSTVMNGDMSNISFKSNMYAAPNKKPANMQKLHMLNNPNMHALAVPSADHRASSKLLVPSVKSLADPFNSSFVIHKSNSQIDGSNKKSGPAQSCNPFVDPVTSFTRTQMPNSLPSDPIDLTLTMVETENQDPEDHPFLVNSLGNMDLTASFDQSAPLQSLTYDTTPPEISVMVAEYVGHGADGSNTDAWHPANLLELSSKQVFSQADYTPVPMLPKADSHTR